MISEHDTPTGSAWRGRTALAIAAIGMVIALSLGITAVISAYTGNVPASEVVSALSTLGGIVIGAAGTYLGMQAKMPGTAPTVLVPATTEPSVPAIKEESA